MTNFKLVLKLMHFHSNKALKRFYGFYSVSVYELIDIPTNMNATNWRAIKLFRKKSEQGSYQAMAFKYSKS